MWTQHRSRALLLGLQLPDGREVAVGNVHLQARSGSENEAQRQAQLDSALRRLCDRGPWSTIVCGDFNSTVSSGSALHELLARGGLSQVPLEGPTLAQRTGYADKLDHIWASKALELAAIMGSSEEVLSSLCLSGLPDEQHPSDHLPVAACFHIGPPPETTLCFETLPPSLATLRVPRECLLQEWLEIRRLGQACSGKRERKEHRKLEGAFFETLSSDEAMNLREWNEVAAATAKVVFRLAVGRALVAVKEAEEFDPGGQDVCDEAMQRMCRGG